MSAGDKTLLGSDLLQQSQVSQWISMTATPLATRFDMLDRLNLHLRASAFLAGASLTAADVLMFAVTRPTIVKQQLDALLSKP